MMPFITRRRHDAEMAKVRAELAAAEKRVFDAEYDLGYSRAHNQYLRERLATAYVRGPKGHFQRAEFPRQDDKAGTDRNISDMWKAASNG